MSQSNKNLKDVLRVATAQLRSEASPILSSMVASFRQHQSAMESRRVQHARTGALNPARLAGFKFTEDIFLKRTFTTKGQNHGLVLHLDWSGSISEDIANVLWQTLNLVWFAETVKIPVEVYCFSTQHGSANGSMVCLYDSASARKLEAQSMLLACIFKFARIPAGPDSYYDTTGKLRKFGEYRGPAGTETVVDMIIDRLNVTDLRALEFNPVAQLGSTPLHHALLASIKHVRSFRERHRVDRCVSVWLTDGEDTAGVQTGPTTFSSYPTFIFRGGREVVISPMTGKTYNTIGRASISTPAQIHKDATGADMVLIHMDKTMGPINSYFNDGAPNRSKLIDDRTAQFNKDGVAVFTSKELGGSPFQAIIMTRRKAWSGREVKPTQFKGVTRNMGAREVLAKTTTTTTLRKFTSMLVPFLAKGDN